MTPNPNEVFNDLEPQEIEALGAFASKVQEHPEVIETLGLADSQSKMLNRVWSKIETGSRQYAESTGGN